MKSYSKPMRAAALAAVFSLIAPSAVFAAGTADDELVTFIVETEYSPAADCAGTLTLRTAAELEESNEEIAETVADEVDSADITDSVIFTRLLSGFTVTAKRGDKDKIAAQYGIENVYEDFELDVTPVTYSSAAESDTADAGGNDTEYRGQGTLIAVIDSGFYAEHEYFSSEVDSPKYTEDTIETKISELGRGTYYNAKIAFAYDYYEKSSDIEKLSNNSSHGTHVAGTAAGKNGTLDNGDVINGAAPEAQLALMACGSSGSSISYSATLTALEDAAALGADVVNMSFGTAYADIRANDCSSIRKAISNARKLGIVVCTSAGNDWQGAPSVAPSKNYGSYVPASMPDYGTQGAYGTSGDLISVASAETPSYYKNLTALIVGDTKYYGQNVSLDGIANFSDTVTAPTEYVDCGMGQVSDFEGKDLSGKTALVLRGMLTFAEKAENAKNAGATSIIIINTYDTYINIASDFLPTMLVTKSTGEAMLAEETKTVYCAGTEPDIVEDSAGSTPSSFSSWGVSPELKLCPTVMGYGGNVFSSVTGGGYDLMSGTSMASPNLAGAAACVKSYIDSNTDMFGSLDGTGDLAELIERLLCSTAAPQRDTTAADSYSGTVLLDKPYYSPRLQGAGLADVTSAVSSPVVIYAPDDRPGISLGEISGESYTLNFTVKNYTDNDITFDSISVTASTDAVSTIDGYDGYYLGGNTMTLPVIDYTDDPVTVPAGGETAVGIDVTLKDTVGEKLSAIFTNGFYIDGFIRLSNDTYSVGMPYMGFRGSWGDVPIFDSTVYDEGGSYLDNGNTLSGTFLTTDSRAVTLGLAPDGVTVDTRYMILSPANADEKRDGFGIEYALLRCTHGLKVGLIAADGTEVFSKTLTSDYLNKYTQYYNGASSTTKNTPQISGLDAIADGAYTLRLTGRQQCGDVKTEQHLDFPELIIDNTAPDVSCELSADGTSAVLTAADANFVRSLTVQYTAADGTEKSVSAETDLTETEVSESIALADIAEGSDLTVTAEDYAYNKAASTLAVPKPAAACFEYTRDGASLTITQTAPLDAEEYAGCAVYFGIYSGETLAAAVAADFAETEGGLEIPAQTVTLPADADPFTVKTFVWTRDKQEPKSDVYVGEI